MPWLGASASRTLRGMTVPYTFSLKNSRTSRATCCPRFVRSSLMVSSTPSMSRDGFNPDRDAAHRPDEIGEPFECEVLAVQRDQHAVGGNERVQREQAERGRAVDEDGVELRRAADRAGAAEAPLAVGKGDQLDFRAGELPRCGSERQIRRSVVATMKARGRRRASGDGEGVVHGAAGSGWRPCSRPRWWRWPGGRDRRAGRAGRQRPARRPG